MGNHPHRLIVSQAWPIAAIEDLEDASFVFNRRVGSLIQTASILLCTSISAIL